MTDTELQLLADSVREFVAERVAAACSPLLLEIRELRDQVRALPAPVNGKDVDPELVRMAIAGEVARQFAELPRPKDGINGVDVDMVEVRGMIREMFLGYPVPKDGKDAAPITDDVLRDQIEQAIHRDLESNASFIRADIRRAVEALPQPKDGRDGIDGKDGLSGKDGRDGIDGMNGSPGRDGIDGKDGTPGRNGVDGKDGQDGINGIDAKDGAPGRDGSNGKDGSPGRDGIDGKDADPIHPDTLARMVSDAVEKRVSAIPVAKDGAPGRDALQIDILPSIDPAKTYPRGTYARHCGAIIRSFRDTDAIPEGELINAHGWEVVIDGLFGIEMKQSENLRSFEVRFLQASGLETKSTFSLPVMIQRGIHISGNEYGHGDVVTLDGSQWHCEVERTKERPGASKDWILIVKHGRNGKDGKDAVGSINPAPQKPVKLQ